MRKLGRQLLAGPYLVWIIGFILLPIVIILYYAFTNTSGAFTWDNIAAIADPVHVKSILLSLKLGFYMYRVCNRCDIVPGKSTRSICKRII